MPLTKKSIFLPLAFNISQGEGDLSTGLANLREPRTSRTSEIFRPLISDVTDGFRYRIEVEANLLLLATALGLTEDVLSSGFLRFLKRIKLWSATNSL